MKNERRYRLINYFDVWGNAEVGYEVNDLCVEETGIFIADDSTDQEVLNLLVRIGFLTTDDSEKVCSVEEQDVQEPRGLAAFFHPKKRKMAYLELTIDYRETAGCFSKRRWLLEPNCTIKIGRSATSDVMMPANNRISRNHCEIFYNEKRRDFTFQSLARSFQVESQWKKENSIH